MIYPEKFRVDNPFGLPSFMIPFKGRNLCVVANTHLDVNGLWEHVSVALSNRNPNWDEMCYIKNLFWGEDEQCLQFHPRKIDYVNMHKHCLHIWRPPFEFQNMLDNIK